MEVIMCPLEITIKGDGFDSKLSTPRDRFMVEIERSDDHQRDSLSLDVFGKVTIKDGRIVRVDAYTFDEDHSPTEHVKAEATSRGDRHVQVLETCYQDDTEPDGGLKKKSQKLEVAPSVEPSDQAVELKFPLGGVIKVEVKSTPAKH
jgi:hypothetical protein